MSIRESSCSSVQSPRGEGTTSHAVLTAALSSDLSYTDINAQPTDFAADHAERVELSAPLISDIDDLLAKNLYTPQEVNLIHEKLKLFRTAIRMSDLQTLQDIPIVNEMNFPATWWGV
jgi:hypothetical protein